ncbi:MULTISPECIES: FMN-binding glutamate synthase family protein [unclassified Nocardioides]|uniref:FMN-binding glutamate synthase family protein n=1 Tax=unclassified Nocardioides TaxID=2615069 RepID=UPI0007030B8A|nr:MULTISPECIES: FMN-binding glutamate synthase family protein [unclassified Nocardioides]KQZ75480.1 glutamate synthase [Nocardioides sp. Root151]KRF14556.1 glutamate synthase [Nocardioides sp. Soil796]
MKWNAIRTVGAAGVAAIGAVAVHDLTQKRHALKRNFPVVANLRYLLESIGPELRQYIITDNDQERPFSRDQRRWVYASSKLENNYFGFGTDNNMENNVGYPIIRHRTFSDVAPNTSIHDGEEQPLPSAKVMGGPRGRTHAFRPNSIVNVSAMSFGSLSGAAIEALNKGAALAGTLHNTGEGALSPHHKQGGDLVFQIGTAYFGCRDEQGRFDLSRLKDVVASAPVKAIEIKLSQGAKPGLGGMLPAAKISQEISEIRGIPMGHDCSSPSRHTEFSDVDSMLDFVETIADATGLPVGIKSAVGNMDFWQDLLEQITPERSVDFITIDGGEGGTGAAPLVFSDSVALPWRLGFSSVFKLFAEADKDGDITWIGSAKLGLPENAIVAMALGADMVNTARGAMLALGCIQAQKCHTDHCPTGVATQNPWLAHGLDPELKSVRVANYIKTMRRDLLKIAEACGVPHPGLIGIDDVDIVDGVQQTRSLGEVYGYRPGWGLPPESVRSDITALMAPHVPTP